MCEQIENFIRVVVSYKKYQIERIEIKYLLRWKINLKISMED